MDFNHLQGKTITSITGCHQHSQEIVFTTSDGDRYRMWHWQSCCEHVSVEDVVGDVLDLIGSPVLRAEERSSGVQDTTDGYGIEQWTFYTIGTIKGTVDLRWFGSSNGYYSTDVAFEQLEPDHDTIED